MATQIRPVPLQRFQQRVAAEVLGRAFFDDPLSVYLLPDERRRARLLPWMYERIVRYGGMYEGDVVTTPGSVEAVAVWLAPGLSGTPIHRLVRCGLALAPLKFGLGAVGRLMAAGHVERLRPKLMPQPHWYLWLLGVDPPVQGRGLGSALVEPALRRADAEGVPCYLETHKERNLAFYRKHGFDVLTEGETPSRGPHYWIMTRQPRR
jgi:ribosomal protein S18 acetylase RimI-like enzyme